LSEGQQSSRPRRSQAERSGQTRERVLAAAIDCLHRRGYAATTTLAVAESAGLSRGAMLHQFPTREELLLYVVRAVYEQELLIYAQRMAAIADPRERLRALPRIVWEVLSRPAGVAVLEVLQGSRSDPALAGQVRALQTRIEADSFVKTARLGADLGIAEFPALVRLIVWAARGLSIAQTLSDDPDSLEDSVTLLRDLVDLTLADAANGARP
jgi:AcrR family transcriptional regulator